MVDDQVYISAAWVMKREQSAFLALINSDRVIRKSDNSQTGCAVNVKI